MQVQETERTAGYRFWFDVREPGAAAYASQLGAHALYFALIFLVPDLGKWFGYWSIAPGAVVVVGLMGAMRRLELWAAVVVGTLAFAVPVTMIGSAITMDWFFVVLSMMPLGLLWGSGLPVAIWAAWVHRGLSREERWDLVGLRHVAAGIPGWRKWIAVYWGAVRPW